MNANELAEKLRRRRQELEKATDWVAIRPGQVERVSTPVAKLTYYCIRLNKSARTHLGWTPKMKVRVEYSPSQKVLRITKSPDLEGYTLKENGQLPGAPIYRTFGIKVLPTRDMPNKQALPPREAFPMGESLVIDVSDLVNK